MRRTCGCIESKGVAVNILMMMPSLLLTKMRYKQARKPDVIRCTQTPPTASIVLDQRYIAESTLIAAKIHSSQTALLC